MEEKEKIEVHLKRKIFWWDGEKPRVVRRFIGTLNTLHLEVIDGQSYVVAPFRLPDEYGSYSLDGLIFPIKESVEFVEEFKAKQASLPKTKKENLIDDFIEDYNDFCNSDDKMHWAPKRIRELLKKKKDD